MKRPGRAASCLVGSVAAHAALAIALAHAEQGVSPAPAHAFQLRLVATQASLAPAMPREQPAAPPPVADAVSPDLPAVSDTMPAMQPVVQAPAPVPGPAPDLKKPRYYLPSELTERPHLADGANPGMSLSVPDVAAQDVDLRLMINRDGTVDGVVVEGEDADPRIKDVLTQAFSNVIFVPGKLNDLVVNSQMQIRVHLDAAVEVISSVAVH